MKRKLSVFLMAVLTVTSVSPAGAHAHLHRAAPAAGTAVRASPPLLQLWFSERLEPALSNVRVFDRIGTQIDMGDAEVDRVIANFLRVSLPKLAQGRYLVKWRVVSVDTHVSEGDFVFDVAP